MTPRKQPKPSPGQEPVLAAVRDLIAAGEAASATAIAERLGMSRQHVSRQLARLERKGFLADVPKVVRSGHWTLTKVGERL